jgi:hypothetical protein
LVILITEEYSPPEEGRRRELAKCRDKNATLGLFEAIVRVSLPGERLRYGSVFRECAERWPEQLCVLANADIWFDESVALLRGIVKKGRLVTLTRWENESAPLMWGYVREGRFFSGTQDVWAFIGGDLVGLGDAIPLGYVGCDQVILGEAAAAGVEVVDPALSIRARHLHARRPAVVGELKTLAGTYVYPELTTMQTTGDYITHEMPKE